MNGKILLTALFAALACTACTDASQPRLSPAPYDVHAHNRFYHMVDPTSTDGFNTVILHDGEQAAATIQRHRASAAAAGGAE